MVESTAKSSEGRSISAKARQGVINDLIDHNDRLYRSLQDLKMDLVRGQGSDLLPQAQRRLQSICNQLKVQNDNYREAKQWALV